VALQRTAEVQVARYPQPSGRRLLVPLTVADGIRGFAAQLRYDSTQLTAVGVRPVGKSRGALVQSNLGTPGVVKLAVASTQALPSGQAFLVEFAVKQNRAGTSRVRLESAAVTR
jgi:hypothetical protein